MSRPHVILKLATSLDGRIATASGESRWITGEAARAEVQKLRASAEAVLIGAGTARADNPSLLARIEPPPLVQPMRVIMTTHFDIGAEGRLFEALTQSPLIVFGVEGANAKKRALLESAGARIECVPGRDGVLDLGAALERLEQLGAQRVLVEGGGKLAASLIARDAVDRLEWFRAPILLGAAGKPAVGLLTLGKLADPPRWRRVAVREVGPDLWESYERAR